MSIEGIESKLISVCLTNDYSLIADLDIFVYRRAECASISLECTNVKLLILNNFEVMILSLYLPPSKNKRGRKKEIGQYRMGLFWIHRQKGLFKDYFRITFCSDLMRNRNIKG